MKRQLRGGVTVAALCLCFGDRAAAATHAGFTITNTATLKWNDSGQQSIASNVVSLTTAELLDVAIVADRTDIGTDGAEIAVGFIVTNTGNGREEFAIATASDQPGVAVTRLAIDANGDGIYDPAVDRMLAAGATLSLAPDQRQRVFILIDGAQVTGPTRISATATATTGSGPAGTIVAGRGDGGGDAVVGQTGATATASAMLAPVAAQPSLTKSQSVIAPDGGARAVRGAIVTYTLVARFPGATRAAVLDDAIPAGTDFVAGSLSLDGRGLSDARDTDAGTADAAGVHVAIGDVADAGTHTIQFSVKIQ